MYPGCNFSDFNLLQHCGDFLEFSGRILVKEVYFKSIRVPRVYQGKIRVPAILLLSPAAQLIVMHLTHSQPMGSVPRSLGFTPLTWLAAVLGDNFA